MTRVCLVGSPADPGFAGLRTRHFARALQAHATHVLDGRADDDTHLRQHVERFGPGAVVSAGNYVPTALATRLAGDSTPLWIDVAGDPFAEAQLVGGQAAATEAVATWVPALCRADAFSVVSDSGRHALVGALGAVGRLPLLSPGDEGIAVCPVAMEFPDPPGAPRGPGLRVALVGGFNTWFDDETLASALLLAMDAAPVELVVTGGAIEGHYTEGFERFRRAMSRHETRCTFHGWLPEAEVAGALDGCHVLVCLDRGGPEPELGSRTRLLYALHRGLRVVTTGRSPLARELAGMGLATLVPAACDVGEETAARAVAHAILEAQPAPDASAARERYSVDHACRALVDWVRQPRRRPAAPSPLAAVAAERDALRRELAELRASPTFRALDWVNRRR